MNAAQWGVIGVIGTLIFGAITLYYLARSNARENRRQQDAAITTAVENAVAPLRAEVAELRQDKRDLQQRVRDLEDELRRGRRP